MNTPHLQITRTPEGYVLALSVRLESSSPTAVPPREELAAAAASGRDVLDLLCAMVTDGGTVSDAATGELLATVAGR